jgi:ubiquinone biosynthesis accessory factor UbiJ
MMTSTLENLLNRGLPRSPRARELCSELTGHKVAVDIRGITRLLISSVGDSLSVVRDATAPADAEIVGGPFALLELAGSEPEAAIQRGDVQIRGDVDLAQKFRELALLLRPDVEEELALAIGDVPAHQLGRFARSALGWGKRAADTTVRNISEFLAHERGDLISRHEGNQFLKGVDALREDVDRAEARLEQIAARLAARIPPKRGA